MLDCMNLAEEFCLNLFSFLLTDWNNLVVAKVSPWIQVDSTDDIVRKNM